MRTLIGAVAILALAGATVAQDKDKFDAKKLVGKWEPKEAKKDAPQMVMEFTKDGKLTATANLGGKELKIDGTYKLEGAKLSLKMKFMDKEIEDTVTLTKLTDEEMTGTGKDGKEETFKKVKEKK